MRVHLLESLENSRPLGQVTSLWRLGKGVWWAAGRLSCGSESQSTSSGPSLQQHSKSGPCPNSSAQKQPSTTTITQSLPDGWHSPGTSMGIDRWPVIESEIWQTAEHGKHPSHFRLINTICYGHPDLVSCRESLGYRHHGDLVRSYFPAVQWSLLYGRDLLLLIKWHSLPSCVRSRQSLCVAVWDILQVFYPTPKAFNFPQPLCLFLYFGTTLSLPWEKG